MTDHMVNLPSAWHYLNQFSSSQWATDPSLMRCGPDATSMAAEFADPGKWIPEQLMDTLYRAWAGNDVASNLQGTTIEQIKGWLTSVGIGFIDMQNLVNEFQAGNRDPLRLELGAMNRQNVPQIITVVDEAPLYEAIPNPNAAEAVNTPYVRGAMLHPWAKPGQYSHVMFRVGYSDSDGYGLYSDGAAPKFSLDSHGSFTPVRILWSDIEQGGVMHCLAIMPHGVPVPPANFDYRTGTWPVPPPPPLDAVQLVADMVAMKAAIDADLAARTAATDALFMKYIAELKG